MASVDASLRSLVTDRLRVELTVGAGFVPHPALTSDGAPDTYLLDQAALPAVSQWLAVERASGTVLDFRIGPPTLDDIYTATVTGLELVAAK